MESRASETFDDSDLSFDNWDGVSSEGWELIDSLIDDSDDSNTGHDHSEETTYIRNSSESCYSCGKRVMKSSNSIVTKMVEKPKRIRFRRKVTMPKLIKTDIRWKYPLMIVKAMCETDVKMVFNFYNTYSIPNFEFYKKNITTKRMPDEPYNMQMRGVYNVVFSAHASLSSSPDIVFQHEKTQILRSRDGTSVVIGTYIAKATVFFDLSMDSIVESFKYEVNSITSGIDTSMDTLIEKKIDCGLGQNLVSVSRTNVWNKLDKNSFDNFYNDNRHGFSRIGLDRKKSYSYVPVISKSSREPQRFENVVKQYLYLDSELRIVKTTVLVEDLQ